MFNNFCLFLIIFILTFYPLTASVRPLIKYFEKWICEHNRTYTNYSHIILKVSLGIFDNSLDVLPTLAAWEDVKYSTDLNT